MKFLLVVVLMMSFNVFADGYFYSTETSSKMDYQAFMESLPKSGNIVLGEYHYTAPIQSEQGRIIRDAVKALYAEDNFTVAWEFMNYKDHDLIQKTFDLYKAGDISEEGFMSHFFGGSADKHVPYMAMVDAARDLGGQFIGVNAYRSDKKEVMDKGLENVDPEIVPPDFQYGSEGYLDRFREAMGGHAPEEMVMKYYLAQCYTDNVMAYQIEELATSDLRFFVVGSFHSDYNDGSVMELYRRSTLPTISIKMIRGNDYSKEELDEILADHPKYGPIANYIYVIQ